MSSDDIQLIQNNFMKNVSRRSFIYQLFTTALAPIALSKLSFAKDLVPTKAIGPQMPKCEDNDWHIDKIHSALETHNGFTFEGGDLQAAVQMIENYIRKYIENSGNDFHILYNVNLQYITHLAVIAGLNKRKALIAYCGPDLELKSLKAKYFVEKVNELSKIHDFKFFVILRNPNSIKLDAIRAV